MTRVFLNGCNGRMGKTIVQCVQETEGIEIVAGADKFDQSAHVFPVYEDASLVKEEFDVIIDFSHISSLPAVLALADKSSKSLIMCTTGFSQEEKEKIIEQGKKTPVFYSANMSLGINVLITLAKKAAAVLYPDFDIEILEAHHNQKLDAPSGTALMIADEINGELDKKLQYVYDRHPEKKKREKNELGMHAIRGGSIAGDHSVIFAGQDEVVTIKHHAQSRTVFARGAVAAARFMDKKPAGLYDMNDLISVI